MGQQMTDPRSGFSNNIILHEPEKLHEAQTRTKEEHTFYFRMIKTTERFKINDSILDTTM